MVIEQCILPELEKLNKMTINELKGNLLAMNFLVLIGLVEKEKFHELLENIAKEAPALFMEIVTI